MIVERVGPDMTDVGLTEKFWDI